MSSNEPLETSIPEGPGVIPDRALFPLLLDEGSPLDVELEKLESSLLGGVSPLVKELVCAEHVGISAGEEDERRALMPNKEE